jgi:hypothetical protein
MGEAGVAATTMRNDLTDSAPLLFRRGAGPSSLAGGTALESSGSPHPSTQTSGFAARRSRICAE